MKGHTSIVSRQCEGLTEKEGHLPKFEPEPEHSTTACDSGPKRGELEFDSPGPNIEAEGPMEREHTSNTR
jgi:hypothetical protein